MHGTLHSTSAPSSLGSGDQDSAVVFKNGRLSVSVRSAVLAQVLEQISGAADLAIIGTEALSPEPLSIKLQDLSLEEGLHRILKNYDVFFFFSAGTEPASQLKAIWVYPRGKGREYVPVPPG